MGWNNGAIGDGRSPSCFSCVIIFIRYLIIFCLCLLLGAHDTLPRHFFCFFGIFSIVKFLFNSHGVACEGDSILLIMLKNIIESLNQAIADKRKENPDDNSIIVSIRVSNYEIEVEMDVYENKSVSVVNFDLERYHDYTNVEEYITNNTVTWDEAEPINETIWTLNGFADEEDYIRYKYG